MPHFKWHAARITGLLLILFVTAVHYPASSALCTEARAPTLRIGAATAEIEADDSMVIGGGIGPGKLVGQEGKLQATAIVLSGNTKLCLVGVDVLMMNRDLLDEAARRIENECRIPFANILINASHTHHAPTTVSIHGYVRDPVFSRRTVEAIVDSARRANAKLVESSPVTPVFRLAQEATVGQNSRQLLKDGKIFWIGPQTGFVRPTAPFDSDLPVLGFRRPDGKLAALIFNHSTHCIGARAPKRSPGFYGHTAQELSEELGCPVLFLSGAAGSTHNLSLSCDEMVVRLKSAIKEGLAKATPMSSARLAGEKKEVDYEVRRFEEEAEDRAVSEYCKTYAPQGADFIIGVFRDMRRQLQPLQGEKRKTWVQGVRIGDVYLSAVPAEFFTALGIEIKRRSPHRYTYVAALSNDYVGYLPDRDGFRLGGYQTWTGLHSFTVPGTGELVVDESIKLLQTLGSKR